MLLGLGVLAAIPLAAVDTSFWQVGTFDEVLKGRLSGVSLDKDGALRLAPESQPVFSPDVTMALSMAADREVGRLAHDLVAVVRVERHPEIRRHRAGGVRRRRQRLVAGGPHRADAGP